MCCASFLKWIDRASIVRTAMSLNARVFILVSSTFAFAGGVSAQEVKVNEVLRSLFYAPQHVALRIGAFEQEGLKIVGPKTTWGVQAALTESSAVPPISR